MVNANTHDDLENLPASLPKITGAFEWQPRKNHLSKLLHVQLLHAIADVFSRHHTVKINNYVEIKFINIFVT